MVNPTVRTQNTELEDITVLPGRRSLDQRAVEDLAKSIQQIGLQHPVTVRFVKDYTDPQTGHTDSAYILVEGYHRLEAVRRLEHTHIPCRVMMEWTERQARMWEISENLHRADLTELQRAEQVAEWMRLVEAEQKEEVSKDISRQIDTKKGRGRRQGGERAASRELGLNNTKARRAKKIDRIAPEAKQAAVESGLDDNQSALLEVAKVADQPVEAQIAKVHEIAEAKQARKVASDRQEPALPGQEQLVGSSSVEPLVPLVRTVQVTLVELVAEIDKFEPEVVADALCEFYGEDDRLRFYGQFRKRLGLDEES
jgi:ParB/RepB/Spo0J family partition protein